MASKQLAKETEVLNKPASAKQIVQLLQLFIKLIYELVNTFTFSQAQEILTQKDAERKLRKKISFSFNVDIKDPWTEEKVWLENFWKIVFDYTINWDDFVLPPKTEEFPHLCIQPAGFTAEQIYSGIVNCKSFTFTKRSKYYSNIDEVIKNAKAVQEHPNNNGNYAWADTGTPEPDTKHRNKSYVMAIAEEFPFLGPVQYLLSCAEFEFRTGMVYDVIGTTYLSVLVSKGYAMRGSWYDIDCSTVNSGSCSGHGPAYGPREAVFA